MYGRYEFNGEIRCPEGDYSTVLNALHQEKPQQYKAVFSFYYFVRRFFSTNWLINRINQKLTSRLLGVKGTYAYLQENAEALRNKNFRFEIDEVEGTLKALYELQADLEQRLEDPAFRQLVKTHEIVSGIIEVMHDTLRLLQKHTLKTPLAEPSEEAKIAVGHSSKTVNKIFYDR